MSKERSLEKHIDHLRVLFLAFVAIDVSLIAWVANTLMSWPQAQRTAMVLAFVVFAIISVVAITILLLMLERLTMRLIRQLEDL